MSGQKMICSGKQLNTGDGWLERTVREVRKSYLVHRYLGFDDYLLILYICTYISDYLLRLV